MTNYSRKSFVSGDHLVSASSMSWTVLWDTAPRPDGQWSAVRTQTEASAFESAAHFLRLGFVVHAIKDPAGRIAMNAESIAARFAQSNAASPYRPERRRSEPEYAALAILRNFAEDRSPIPGLMVALRRYKLGSRRSPSPQPNSTARCPLPPTVAGLPSARAS